MLLYTYGLRGIAQMAGKGLGFLGRYCAQCSTSLFGTDFGDFLYHSDLEDALGQNLQRCCRCGWTLIDRTGQCLLLHKEHMKYQEREYVPQLKQIIERFFGPEEAAKVEEEVSDELGARDSFEIEANEE
jgi:hypothetical protein